jgi:hypothetical protein
MADPDSIIKNQIAGFLVSRGLTVKEIPRSQHKTPDLLVEEGTTDAVLLEIKVKTDNPDEMQALAEKLAKGGIVGRSKPTDGWNRLDALISYAVRQFEEDDPGHQFHRVVWFCCVGLDSHLYEERLKATIYGSQKLISMEISGVVTAYYFWNSAFFRNRGELDGIVILRGDQAQLHLNEHSSRFASIAQSAFAKAFGPGVFYPKKYATGPEVMICDFAGLRDASEPMLDFLRTKYGVEHLQTINMGMHSAMLNRPEDPPDRPPGD